MLTYAVWTATYDFTYWSGGFRKMASYACTCLLNLITIPFDILFSPFEIMGIIIYFITRRKK